MDSIVVSISSRARDPFVLLETGEGFAAIASKERSVVTGEGDTMLSRKEMRRTELCLPFKCMLLCKLSI